MKNPEKYLPHRLFWIAKLNSSVSFQRMPITSVFAELSCKLWPYIAYSRLLFLPKSLYSSTKSLSYSGLFIPYLHFARTVVQNGECTRRRFPRNAFFGKWKLSQLKEFPSPTWDRVKKPEAYFAYRISITRTFLRETFNTSRMRWFNNWIHTTVRSCPKSSYQTNQSKLFKAAFIKVDTRKIQESGLVKDNKVSAILMFLVC